MGTSSWGLRRTVLAPLAVTGLTAGMLVAGTSTAVAAPGAAMATGVDLDATITPAGASPIRYDRTVGQVDAPLDDAASLTNLQMGENLPLPADLRPLARVATLNTTATSNGSGSAATARLTGIELNTPVGPVGIQAVGAQVNCPANGAPTASVDRPVAVTFAGRTVAVDTNGEATFTAPAPGIAGSVTIDIDERRTTTTTAAATAVQASARFEVPGVLSGSGELTVAQTSCEKPAPQVAPLAWRIKPKSSPTAGGTTVTVTGKGFVPGQTTVTIGGTTVPANAVNVAADGRSLTFVTPAHAPGRVQVVVTTPGGSTEPLRFRYKDTPPTVSWMSPRWGPTSGGTTVRVHGAGFAPGETTVTIGGTTVPADRVSVAADGRSLSFDTPRHRDGWVEVVVTTPSGAAAPQGFKYVGWHGKQRHWRR